jgi:hypothetical protein
MFTSNESMGRERHFLLWYRKAVLLICDFFLIVNYRPRDASSKGHIIQETYDPRKYLRGRYLQGASSEGEEVYKNVVH